MKILTNKKKKNKQTNITNKHKRNFTSYFIEESDTTEKLRREETETEDMPVIRDYLSLSE